MENWTNLNRMLTLERKSAHQEKLFAQQMIEACMKGEKNVIIALLKQGALANCYEDMLTPLIACIDNDQYSLAVYLVNIGATISYRPDPKNLDAFWHALKNKKYDFLEFFVRERCLLTWEDGKQPPLIFATLEGDVKSVEILLKHRAIKVNERDGFGKTALHYNVSKESPTDDDIEIGRMLIAAGADTNIRDMDQKTPEDLAQDFSTKSMLMASKLERDLPVHEEPIVEPDPLQEDNGVKKTKQNKIKI